MLAREPTAGGFAQKHPIGLLYAPPRKRGGVRGGVSREQPLPPSPSPLAERGRKAMLSDFLCKATAGR